MNCCVGRRFSRSARSGASAALTLGMLVSLHATGCFVPDECQSKEVFGSADYEVRGIAIDVGTGEVLTGPTVSMLVFGYDAGDVVPADQFTAQTNDTGTFVLPQIELGLTVCPPPALSVILEAERDGERACATRIVFWSEIPQTGTGVDIVDLGPTGFDFAGGPCVLAE
jgi:hypothetical protein